MLLGKTMEFPTRFGDYEPVNRLFVATPNRELVLAQRLGSCVDHSSVG